jgi:hypothetical protein
MLLSNRRPGHVPKAGRQEKRTAGGLHDFQADALAAGLALWIEQPVDVGRVLADAPRQLGGIAAAELVPNFHEQQLVLSQPLNNHCRDSVPQGTT